MSSAKPPALPPLPRAADDQPSEQPTVVALCEEDLLTSAPPEPAATAHPTDGHNESAGAVPLYHPTERKVFGRFELLIEMGRGGMATLFLARIRGPSDFEKLLAIKKIHDHLAPDEQFVRMFLDEARIAAKIHHPNVATTFDMGRIESSYFIAMEYVHGQNLTDVLKAGVRDPSKLPWTHAARIVADAATGLHAAHELRSTDGKPLNVVHRDVSPQNILISYDGNVKVVDFGIAFAAEKLEHTAAGTLKGKASYMSPEQAMGEPLDRRSDIFALGIVLWECVCLKRLFRQSNEGATLLKVREAEVPPPRSIRPDLPEDMESVILKALRRDRDERYETAEELSEALEDVLLRHGKRVGPKQVGKVLDDMFHDRRTLKDEQIQLALESASTAPLVGVGMRGSDTLSLSRISDPGISGIQVAQGTSPQISRGRQLVVGLLVLVFLGVLGVAGLLLWDRLGPNRRSSPRATRSKPAAAVTAVMRPLPPTPRPRKARVTIRVQVTPPLDTVKVHFHGKEYTGPVIEMLVRRSNTADTLLLEAPGYARQTLVVVPSGDALIPVTLVKAAPVMRPRVKHPPRRYRSWHRRRRPRQPGLWDLKD